MLQALGWPEGNGSYDVYSQVEKKFGYHDYGQWEKDEIIFVADEDLDISIIGLDITERFEKDMNFSQISREFMNKLDALNISYEPGDIRLHVGRSSSG